MTRTRRVGVLLAALVLLLAAACGTSPAAVPSLTSITVYTCVSDTTIQPIIKNFEAAHAGTTVKLFRAPTGQLNARVASDVRAGGLKADVIWACDPLTMQDYVTQGLVGGWTPDTQIPARVSTADYVGVAMLYMVAVTGASAMPPTTWRQFAASRKVAVPDPRVAASALGALGYFGTGFYAELKKSGAVQVSTPDDVTNGVAQGTYDAGLTIASSAYAAQQSGSPVTVSWPKPGAVAIYGPIALSKSTQNVDNAQAFIRYVASKEGQTVIGSSGSYPALPGVAGPTKPDDAPAVYPDWMALASQKATLLSGYAKIFGG